MLIARRVQPGMGVRTSRSRTQRAWYPALVSTRTVGVNSRVDPRGPVIAAAIALCSSACTLGPFAAADASPSVDTTTEASTDATVDSDIDASVDVAADAAGDTTQSNYRVVADGGVWALPRLGPAGIEGPYGSGCPANTVVTGAYFEWESIGWGNGGVPRVIQFFCSPINPNGSLGSPSSSMETAVTLQPSREFQGLMTGSDFCAAGEVVVGLYGMALGDLMSQIGLECAPLVDWVRNPGGTAVHQLGMHGSTNPLNMTTTMPWERSCSAAPYPAVLSRIDGIAGYWFQNLTATCIEVAR